MMNEYPPPHLARGNPMMMSALQQQQQSSQHQQQQQQAAGSSLTLSSSRLPSASSSNLRSIPSSISLPPSLQNSIGNSLTLGVNPALSRPSSLSNPSLLQQQQQQQVLSSLSSRSQAGLLSSLPNLSSLPLSSPLFSSGGGLLAPSPLSHSFNQELLMTGKQGAASQAGYGSQQLSSQQQQHSLSSLSGLSGLQHLTGGMENGMTGGAAGDGRGDRDGRDGRERGRENGSRFDLMSDFPSLSEAVEGKGGAGGGSSQSQQSLSQQQQAAGSHAQLNSDFAIQNEEFPALSAAVSTAAAQPPPSPADRRLRALLTSARLSVTVLQRRPAGGSMSGSGRPPTGPPSHAPSASFSYSQSTAAMQQPISLRTQSTPMQPPPPIQISASALPSSSPSMQLPSTRNPSPLSIPKLQSSATVPPPSSASYSPIPPSTPTSASSTASGASIASAASASTAASSALSSSSYGLTGLLSVIRMTDPDLNTLALGTDLTTLGLNLSSTEVLYATFAYPASPASPTTSAPADYVLPFCYYMQPPALKTSHLSKFTLETLFYIFYCMPRDTLQVYASKELYSRDWRYHKDIKLWLTRSRGAAEQAAGGAAAAAGAVDGDYVFFDVGAWETRVFRDTHILQPHKFLTEEELASI